MEMDSDSSTNGSVAIMSEKKPSFATIPVDIENQTGDVNNEDLNAVGDIHVELKNIIHDTEQILDTSLEEFRNLAGEHDDTAPKTESEDNDKLDDTESIARTMSGDSSRWQYSNAVDREGLWAKTGAKHDMEAFSKEIENHHVHNNHLYIFHILTSSLWQNDSLQSLTNNNY